MKQTDEFTNDLQRAMVKAGREMGRIVRRMNEQMAAMRANRTPEQIDAGSQWRYEMAVRRERAKGVQWVKDYAAGKVTL